MGASWDSDVDMDTVCPPELDVCGSSFGRTAVHGSHSCAVLEAGAETKFCASLLQPNETVVMTVTLRSQDKNTTLLKQIMSEEFHARNHFQVPVVQNQEVQRFEVEVQVDTFYSKEVRKVMIRVYQPMTFIQTDKPMYLPGQTVHFRVVTLDTRFRPASRLYNIIEIEDANNNRIGQWLNETSSGKILQLSYSLNSEAREGSYQVIVSFGEEKIYHSFKVEKYVLPKFDVKIDTSDEVSIEQEEIKAEVCAKYTYGQPVPGSVKVKVCRPLQGYYGPMIITPDNPEGIPEITAPCHKETVQTDKTGCAAFTFKMSAFTKVDQKVLRDHLDLSVEVEEEGTGISRPQQKRIQISYVIGRLSFIDTPKIYDQGSNVEGKVKAVHYNDTPIPDMAVYLLEGDRWSTRQLQNLTTDSDGVATFSFSTANLQGDIELHVSSVPTLDYSVYRTCDREDDIFIRYTVVGEKQGSVDVMYLVLSRGAIVMQGFKQVEVQDTSVNEGEVENVIAHSADFSTEKCFSHKVSLEFSPSSAVPGEETTMQEPGKTLNADKIFNLFPVSKVSHVPYEVRDPVECVHVRPRRYIMPYPGQEINDAHTVFQNVGLKMATNMVIRMPSCLKYKGREYATATMVAGSAPRGGAYPDAPPLETVRTFFPETWRWDLVEVRETGTKDVPHCTRHPSPPGRRRLGLSQQGFVWHHERNCVSSSPSSELTLPYSIIRGEHFELKATFNYLTSCIM
ncbi:alpha-2-macroglobulin-like protein [Lates japonicus]|uniref:Alpha-2-macroglobulin-like protein n=1 Tax=Lates japonicus TaxID=270547 RepID=A0AAD3R2T2_LATJO|nr:alpha-2-macroglobulin-like protein [Lates japonicus]